MGRAGRAEPGRRTLIAAVGYRELADFSVGPLAFDELEAAALPSDVDLEDFSYNPVTAVHTLQDRPGWYRRAVFIGAARRGRAAGSVLAYRWDGVLPDEEEIQARIAEAVTGVIDLDNLVVILGQFDVLPEEVIVVEVEPEREAFGEAMSARGRAAFGRVLETVRELAGGADLDDLPLVGLGGAALAR